MNTLCAAIYKGNAYVHIRASLLQLQDCDEKTIELGLHVDRVHEAVRGRRLAHGDRGHCGSLGRAVLGAEVFQAGRRRVRFGELLRHRRLHIWTE